MWPLFIESQTGRVTGRMPRHLHLIFEAERYLWTTRIRARCSRGCTSKLSTHSTPPWKPAPPPFLSEGLGQVRPRRPRTTTQNCMRLLTVYILLRYPHRPSHTHLPFSYRQSATICPRVTSPTVDQLAILLVTSNDLASAEHAPLVFS